MTAQVRRRAFVYYASVMIVKLSILGSVGFHCYKGLSSFYDILPQAVQIQEHQVDPRIEKLTRVVKYLGCPDNKSSAMVLAIIDGADKINVDPVLIAVLIRTESDFDKTVVSSKGYKGLMQTPIATKQWEDVDILIGCKIFEEKLRIAKGDVEFALALYKGGNNPAAKKLAKQVLSLYGKVKDL